MVGPKILIIGGTAEARKLAASIEGDVTTSLAGATRKPAAIDGKIRTGGFGGVSGLIRYLRDEHIDLVIDASHPYAATMQHHVIDAVREVDLDAIRINRPEWNKKTDDQWVEANNAPDALAKACDLGRQILLTHGRELPDSITAHRGQFYLRTIEPVAGLAGNITWIKAELPLRLDKEIALIREFQIDVLVSKQSGGAATYAKIDAARAFGIPVVMIKRPHVDGALMTVSSAEDVLAWLGRRGRNT